MIKLDGPFVIANTSEELNTLQSLIGNSYPEFVYSIVDNKDDNFPFKLMVYIDTNIQDVSMPPMDVFFDFLLTKINEVNQQ